MAPESGGRCVATAGAGPGGGRYNTGRACTRRPVVVGDQPRHNRPRQVRKPVPAAAAPGAGLGSSPARAALVPARAEQEHAAASGADAVPEQRCAQPVRAAQQSLDQRRKGMKPAEGTPATAWFKSPTIPAREALYRYPVDRVLLVGRGDRRAQLQNVAPLLLRHPPPAADSRRSQSLA